MNRRLVAPAVTFGDVHYPPGGALGPRIQQDFQIVVIYEGEARIQIDDHELLVPQQHAVLLLPQRREQFHFARNRPTRHTWCALAPRSVPQEVQDQVTALAACVPLTQRIHSLIEYGLAIPANLPAPADTLAQAVGLAALQAFAFEAALVHHTNDSSNAVERAVVFIETNLAEQLDLAQVAQAASMTPQHLTRLFHRQLQQTPMRYVWQLRTRRGVELLGETGLSVAEIAERVGFQSPFHFSRMVRRQYHFSPRQLRQQLWRGEGPPEAPADKMTR